MNKDTKYKTNQNDQTTVVVNQSEQSSWWSSLDPKQRKLINSIAIGLGVSALVATGIYFGSKFIRNKIANHTESESFGGNMHSTWAKQIKNAFVNNGWWGTDEVLLRNTLTAIPSKQDFKKVQIAYRKLFKGENLVEKMTGELKQNRVQ